MQSDKKELFQTLNRRGFIKQYTDEQIEKILSDKKVIAYTGYDPTSDGLHIGHLLTVIGLTWFQKFGHKPIAVVGGATALVGDPSGKTEMRKMLTIDQVNENAEGIKKELSRFVKFGSGSDEAIMVNNADWLYDKRYIDFLRDIGKHFSVNRMLTMESVKLRLEKGLSFIEFNYMILQAYDFMHLNKHFDCNFQLGGDDQWGNIVMGIDLTRRINQKEVYGITYPLISTSSGQKMGKTEAGALWLNSEKTSVYDFYQYWINVDDKDVKRFLYLYTFLPEHEVEKLGNLKDAEIRDAKKVLAYEVTKLVHGESEADNAIKATEATFGKNISGDIDESITTNLDMNRLNEGLNIITILSETNLVSSNSEARRMISQGGVYVNEDRVSDAEYKITKDNIVDNNLIRLRVGKKKYHILRIN